MAVGKGATSLVELILKKFADDTAGAAKELERLGGFPEPVAQRIASGELPMDAASVATRRGLFEDAEGFHGSTHDIKNFDGSATSVDNDFGQGTYITDDSYDASENYAGIGADLTNRLERHAESNWFQTDKFDGPDHVRTIGGEDFTKAQWDDLEYDQKMGYLRRDAFNEIGGETRGIMYPVSVNHGGVVNSTDSIRDSIEMKDWDDYLTEAAEDLEPSYKGETVQSLLDPDSEYYDEIHDLATEMQYGDETSPNMIAYDVMRRYGLDEGPFEIDQLDTWQDLRDVMDDKIANGWYPQGDDGEMITSGGILSEVMQELGLKGYNDMSSASRFSGMEGGAGNHTIMFPGSENQIRSVNAAYDPQYKGSNMMGNADPRLLGGLAAGTAGLLALGASDDADAGVAGRVLAESGLAYKQLRKQVARNKQNGISPGNTVKQWVHDKKNTTYNDMNSYATKVDGGKGGDYYKQQTQNIVDQILEGVENPDKDLVAGLAEWNGARQSRELGHRPDWEKGAASPGLLGGTAAVTAGALATPALMKDEPFDPTAPLPAPDFATQMGKAGEVLGAVLDAPMTGLQGIARGLFGLIEGEDLVTAGAEANHMMKGGSEEGFDRVGDKVEGLFAPIDKQFPYLNVGKSAGDATSLLMSLFSPI